MSGPDTDEDTDELQKHRKLQLYDVSIQQSLLWFL